MKTARLHLRNPILSLYEGRMVVATRLHCRVRTPTTLAVAVASPPTHKSSTIERDSKIPIMLEAISAAPSAFLALGVDPMLAASLPAIEVMRPSPIQAAALPAVLSGANCAIQSFTGSGKTLSYLLPALTLALKRAEILAADPSTPRRGGVPEVPVQVLVVAPSQELAMQIVRVAKSLLPPDVGRYAVQQVIGGANPKRQAEALAMVPGPLLVVGTPGRLAEMIRTGSLRLHYCHLLVLDEADQLLASAFAEDINHISEHCGKRVTHVRPDAADEFAAARRQTVLVSATLTPSVLSRAARWCPAPRFVSAGAVPEVMSTQRAGADAGKAGENPSWGWGVRGWDGPASTFGPKVRGSAGGVESDELVPTMPPQLAHYFMVVEHRHKVDALRRAIHALGVQRALVFMNFQQRLQDAQFKLKARGIKAAALHGELPRLVRGNLLNDFRRGRLRALVVSDVAARGIDIPSCDAVFHLELPSSAAHYAHRAGRTGRLSAALAAQAAAEATAVAAAAAAAEKGGDTTAAAKPRPAMAGDVDVFLEQAAGTVVTILTPSERFVVDKIAAQLGVPLLEAHVSHGQLQLGPPPGGYSFDKDEESDRTEEPKSGRTERRRERKAHGSVVSEASQRDAGAEASTSGRSPTLTTWSKPESLPATVLNKRSMSKTSGNMNEVIVDKDYNILEDDPEDDNILDEDLQAFKRLRPAEIRQLGSGFKTTALGTKLEGQQKPRVVPPWLDPTVSSGGSGGSSVTEPIIGNERTGAIARGLTARQRKESGNGHAEGLVTKNRPPTSAQSDVMEELRRELAELSAEKDLQKQQMRARGSKGTKSP